MHLSIEDIVGWIASSYASTFSCGFTVTYSYCYCYLLSLRNFREWLMGDKILCLMSRRSLKKNLLCQILWESSWTLKSKPKKSVCSNWKNRWKPVHTAKAAALCKMNTTTAKIELRDSSVSCWQGFVMLCTANCILSGWFYRSASHCFFGCLDSSV